jgi:hypothetical protein
MMYISARSCHASMNRWQCSNHCVLKSSWHNTTPALCQSVLCATYLCTLTLPYVCCVTRNVRADLVSMCAVLLERTLT